MSRVHAVFYGRASARAGAIEQWRFRPAALLSFYRRFYRDPVAWPALVTTSIIVCYGGGLMMFWFHAVALGEGGPAISWYAHWLLDSTFAFLALSPALALILPFAAWCADRLAGPDDARVPWLYVTVAGGLFAVATVPGPIAHNLLVGRGTWLADRVTGLIGNPSAALTPGTEYPAVALLSQQLGAAVPTYLLCMAVAVVLIRMIAARRQRAVVIEAQAIELARRFRLGASTGTAPQPGIDGA